MKIRTRPKQLPPSGSIRWRDRPLRPPGYEDQRDRVLDVAERLFAERGLGQVSFVQIADAAGMRDSSARSRFGNVELMLEGVLDRHADRIVDRLRVFDETSKDTDPLARLTTAIGCLIETLHARRSAQRTFVAAMHAAPASLAQSLVQRQRYVTYWFAGLIADCVPEMDGETDITMPLAMSLMGMIGWHVLWFRESGTLSRSEYCRLLTLMIIEAARAALRERLGAWTRTDTDDATP